MHKPFMPIIIVAFSVLIFSCGDAKNPKLKDEAKAGSSKAASTDTLSNELQCAITVDDKTFTIPADNITTSYTFSDSSLVLAFKGVGNGLLRLEVPNIFKCPMNVPTGYSSVRFKIAGTEEYSTEPTVYLQQYPEPGLEFNNLVDGHNKTAVKDNAFEITAIRVLEENTSSKWAVYLIKGKINTTVFKSSYEAKGNDRNHEVAGSFVLQTKIYF